MWASWLNIVRAGVVSQALLVEPRFTTEESRLRVLNEMVEASSLPPLLAAVIPDVEFY